MRKLLWLVAMILLWVNSYAVHYFVSAAGNDANNGTSAGTPFKTLAKANAVSVAGDIISLNGGDTFAPLIITKSGTLGNPITYNSYGTGKGIISGFTTVSSWTNLGSNIWESTNAVSVKTYTNVVAINGVNTGMGRFPNTGYFPYQSFSGLTSITSSSVNAAVTNWTGALVVIRKLRYVINALPITAMSGSTITYSGEIAQYPSTAGWGFFIEDDPRTLDVQNEWYFSPTTRKIRIFSTSSPTGVRIATSDTLVNCIGRSNIVFDGISLIGSNYGGFIMGNVANSQIKNCTIDFCFNGILGQQFGGSSANVLIDNNVITNSSNVGIIAPPEFSPVTITNNTITKSGLIVGVSARLAAPANNGNNGFGDGQSQGMNIGSTTGASGAVIQSNIIDSSGYNGIGFQSNSSNVSFNYVNNSCLIKDDGGGIYTGNAHTNVVISSNVVLNSVGNGAGTTNPDKLAYGIYLDGNEASGYSVLNNSVANTVSSDGQAAYFFHNPKNVIFNYNTAYNFRYCQWLVSNDQGGTTTTGMTVKGNIFFSKPASQFCIELYTVHNNIPAWPNSAGAIDSNYYARPITFIAANDGLTNNSKYTTGLTNWNLPQWKTFSTFDVHSNHAPIAVTNVNQLDFEYNATAIAAAKSLPPGVWKDVRNVSYTGTITLQAYTSAVLMNTGTVNTAPTANAGIDQTIQLPTSSVNLVGTGSDVDGSIVTYAWTLVSGSGTITSPNTASTSVTGLTGGISQFKLTVTDNLGASGSDNMIVTVNPANVNPTANAGTDQAIQLPTSTTTLVGSGNDPDGSITGYLWTKLSGPAGGTITSPTSATTGITALAAGTYVFNLRVTDNQGATGNDQVSVIVSASANVAPTANAGIDQTIQLPVSSANLVGSGNDPDGSITAYLWTQISGPAATITSPTTASTSVTGMNTANTYQFKLTVTDNGTPGLTGSDNMIVTVTPANISPVVNAGTDQSITAPTSVVTLSGSASDPDGSISSHTWTKISGTGGTITSPNNFSTTVTGLTVGTYVFRLTATDNQALTGFDEVTILVNPAININPVADAGADQVITYPTTSVTLTGSGTDADGTIVAYNWIRISGSGTITSPASATTTVTGFTIGVSVFQLMVTDNSGGTGTNNMQVTLNPGAETISASNIIQQYNSLPLFPTITTSPIAGQPTSTLFNGVGAAPVNAGSYNAHTANTSPNWIATPIDYIFTVTPKPGTITVTNLLQAYDGTQKSVSVSTSDPFPTETRYDGSLTPSISAGNHTVITRNLSTNYSVTPDTSILVITQSIPTVSWGTPAPKTYPYALDGTVQNATASVPGIFTYVPAAGFIPTPGNNTLIVNFVPNDSLNFAKVNGTSVVLVVNKGSLIVNVIDTIQSFDTSPKFITAFTAPTNTDTLTIVYDDAHTSVGDHTGHVSFSSSLYSASTVNFTLHITANAANIFITNFANRTYTGSGISPTVTTAPPSLPYTITFNGSGALPINAGSYPNTIAKLDLPNVGADTVTMTIIKATPTTSWTQIANGGFPYVVGAGILNASSPVAGTWSYNVSVGDTLSVGQHTITGTFTPTDAANYNVVVITNTFTVGNGTASMSFINTSQVYDGTPKAVLVVTNPANLTGITILYNGSINPPTISGIYPISAQMVNANWNAPTINGTLTITKSNNYTLAWNTPAPIQQGSRITASILNPTSTIAGTFSFNYPLNTQMNNPGTFALIGTFTPTDGNYNTKTITVPLSVYGSPFLDFYIDHNIYLNLPNQ